MAFSLTKEEHRKLAGHIEALNAKLEGVRTAEGERVDLIQHADDKVGAAVSDYNGVLADARTFVEEITQRLQDEYDEKSERWQEGDKGQAVTELIGEWEGVDMEDVDSPETDRPEELDIEHSSALEGLSTETAE